MERLGEDELISIFDKISSPYDKKSFSRVCKKFLKTACFRLWELEVRFPDILYHMLFISPKMRRFICTTHLSNNHLSLLARSCPNLSCLILPLENYNNLDPDIHFDDFNDNGLCAVAAACRDLYHVVLIKRLHVGDIGISSLVRLCKNLDTLYLDECVNITDESLKAISEANCLTSLSFVGCHQITSLGWKCLGNETLKNRLRYLNLSGCDSIHDTDIFNLKQMRCLKLLYLSDCGDNITESGVTALSQIPNIEVLSLCRLINVTDKALFEIGSKCCKLKQIYLNGCEAISCEGLRVFSHHPTLEEIQLFSCQKVSWKDVNSVVLTCKELYKIGVDRRIKPGISEEACSEYVYIGNHFCRVDWK